jgi:hypothetical protein
MSFIRNHAAILSGVTNGELRPPSPRRIASVTSPKSIRFIGSAWAKSYRIIRTNPNSSTVVVGESVSDALAFGSVIFNDETAQPNTAYFYEIIPKNSRDVASFNTLIIGPLSF